MSELRQDLIEEIYRLQPDGCGQDIRVVGFIDEQVWKELSVLKRDGYILGCLFGGSEKLLECQIEKLTNEQASDLLKQTPHKIPDNIAVNTVKDEVFYNLSKWNKLNLTPKGYDKYFKRCHVLNVIKRSYAGVLSTIAIFISLLALFKDC